MKTILSILIFLVSFSFANEPSCKELYNNFKSVLEPQMTQLCVSENNENIVLYDFYIYDPAEGYTQFELAMSPKGQYLFIEGEKNPFKCGNAKDNKYQNVDEILKMLFINKECEDGFLESIGVTNGK